MLFLDFKGPRSILSVTQLLSYAIFEKKSLKQTFPKLFIHYFYGRNILIHVLFLKDVEYTNAYSSQDFLRCTKDNSDAFEQVQIHL